MYNPVTLRRELVYVGAGFLFLWGLCELAGITRWLLVLAAAAYVAWHLYHLWTLLRWLDSDIKRLPSSARGVWGYIFYRLEVKRRKAAKRKKQVGRLLKQFKSSTRALPDATIVLNRDLGIQWLNSAATDILGVKKSDVGQPITNLIRHPDFRQYLTDGNFSEGLQLKGQHRANTRIAIIIVPYEGKQYLLLARDVTQEHRLESMRRDFVSNASHELRTPLSVLQGSIEQMEQIVEEDSPLANPLARMRRQSQRMMSILRDLLILARLESRREPMQMHEVNLSLLLAEIVEEARVASTHLGGHRIQADIEEGLLVLGDQDDLHGTITNLVMNAVRYTPAGREIRITLFQSPDGIHFEVADSGVGILPQHLPRLTERFYRIDVGRSREAGGTGLGLSIVKHLLEQYGSTLDISSEPGEGSTFGFTLPQEFICQDSEPGKQAGTSQG